MHRELDPDNPKQLEKFLSWIRRWLDARAGRRLILLLDEADEFLVKDAKSEFRESTRLKGLMDDTERRFKVVFAGLHNVLRTTRQGWCRLELSGLGKRWSSFWRKSSNRKANGDSGGFEFRAFIDFSDAYTGFAKRLFYALSGFNHDANFVPSSSPTVI